MQVVITQNTLIGEMQYHYETRVISLISLHLDPSNYPDQPNPHNQLKEPWANKLLWTHRWALNQVSIHSWN